MTVVLMKGVLFVVYSKKGLFNSSGVRLKYDAGGARPCHQVARIASNFAGLNSR